MEFTMKSGIVTGRGHIVYGINCQDSLQTIQFEHNGETYYAGIVTDGCGEGTRSETGAHLATSFLSKRVEELIKEGVSPKKAPRILFWDLVEFLRSIVINFQTGQHPHAQAVKFIKEHLLFTVLGFIIGPKDTVIFAVGDGVVVLNDMVDLRDQDNMPTYPAYHLVDEKFLKQKRSPLPTQFDVYTIKTKKLKRLAVGTDAWEEEVGTLLSLWGENASKSLQRTMNLMSNKEKRFKDDAAIIAVDSTPA